MAVSCRTDISGTGGLALKTRAPQDLYISLHFNPPKRLLESRFSTWLLRHVLSSLSKQSCSQYILLTFITVE